MLPKPSTQNTTQPPADPSNTPDPVDPPGKVEPPAITLDAHHAQIEKARKEEKDKLYPELETTKSQKAEAERKTQLAEARANAAEKKLRELEQAALSENDKAVALRLEQLEQQSKAAKEAADGAVTAAREEAASLRLQLAREQKLRDSGLSPEFADLVTGTSPESIDASIKKAKERETALRARIEADLRKQEAASRGREIPESGTGGDGASEQGSRSDRSQPNIRERENIVHLPKDKYAEERAKRLAEARKTMPTGSKYAGR